MQKPDATPVTPEEVAQAIAVLEQSHYNLGGWHGPDWFSQALAYRMARGLQDEREREAELVLLTRLAIQAVVTRRQQREYFKTRSQLALQASKAAERILDDLAEHWEKDYGQG